MRKAGNGRGRGDKKISLLNEFDLPIVVLDFHCTRGAGEMDVQGACRRLVWVFAAIFCMSTFSIVLDYMDGDSSAKVNILDVLWIFLAFKSRKPRVWIFRFAPAVCVSVVIMYVSSVTSLFIVPLDYTVAKYQNISLIEVLGFVDSIVTVCLFIYLYKITHSSAAKEFLVANGKGFSLMRILPILTLIGIVGALFGVRYMKSDPVVDYLTEECQRRVGDGLECFAKDVKVKISDGQSRATTVYFAVYGDGDLRYLPITYTEDLTAGEGG